LGSQETVTVRQEIFRATKELGDPVQHSVWWQWTAPRDGWWEVEVLAPEGRDRREFSSSAPVQIFIGDQFENLREAQDGGLATPRPNYRPLFHATAGRVFQIAAANENGGRRMADAAFTLRPVVLGKNVSATEALPLQRQPGAFENWSGSELGKSRPGEN